MKLYNYFRSSASYRVRIALHHKGLEFDYVPVHLVQNGGEQNSEAFRKLNPMGHVPALEHEGVVIAESMAILDYLDMSFRQKPLFPSSAIDRAKVLQLCEVVNSGIQPLQNLKVMKFLETKYSLSKADSEGFVKHWIQDGMTNLEKILSATAGDLCFGNALTAADCFLIPQCFTTLRFGIDLARFPTIAKVYENALELPEVMAAHPENQPDFKA